MDKTIEIIEQQIAGYEGQQQEAARTRAMLSQKLAETDQDIIALGGAIEGLKELRNKLAKQLPAGPQALPDQPPAAPAVESKEQGGTDGSDCEQPA